MDKSTSLPVQCSECELSMESIEELAIEQIQQEYDNEQILIQNIQQEHFEMNNNKMNDAIVRIVNSELQCHICKSIPCAMITKHTVVKKMVDDLSNKWDITRSTGNNNIREAVFKYLENDHDVPLINGHIPDCVLSGVLDLIPDPISSFPAINNKLKRSGEEEYDCKTTTTSHTDNTNMLGIKTTDNKSGTAPLLETQQIDSSNKEVIIDENSIDKLTNRKKQHSEIRINFVERKNCIKI